MIEAAQPAAESAGALGRLGVDWKLLLAQLVNFSLVALAVWRWVYRPLLKTMDDRSAKIEQGLKDAKDAASAKMLAETNASSVVAEARREASRIIEEAERAASAHREQQTKRTKDDVEALIRRGKEQMEQEKTRSIEEAKAELKGVIALAVERIAGEKLDEKKDSALIDRAMTKI